MTLKRRLKRVFDEILKELDANPSFAERINIALGMPSPAPQETRKRRRRNAATLDPIMVLETEGEELLKEKLATLDVEQLKDIVAEYGMDPAKLVMKWSNIPKITDHIISIANSRSKKGDAFR